MAPISLLVLWAAIMNMGFCYDYNSCADDRKLGSVLDVTFTPSPRPGGPLDASIRITTPFTPKGTWWLRDGTFGLVSYGDEDMMTESVYPVPDSGEGDMRASTKYEGQNTYLFSIHVEQNLPNRENVFGLTLEHPCNTIEMWGLISDWSNITGQDLPTALRVPKSFVDLSRATEQSMKIGIEGSPGMDIKYAHVSFKSQRRFGKLYERSGRGGRDPIRFDWSDENGGRRGRLAGGAKVEGELVMTKRSNSLRDGTQAMTLASQCLLPYPSGGRFFVSAWTQILLKESGRGIAIGLKVFQYHHKFLSYSKNGEFFDSDGTRVLVVFLDKASPLPAVFGCWAEAGVTTPYVAAAQISGDENGFEDEVVLEPVYVVASHGVAYNIYEVPKMAVGEETNMVCSAAADEIKNTFFKIKIVEPVQASTENETNVVLNEDTFKNGYRFTCRANAVPKPSFVFFKDPSYSMSYPPNLNSRLVTWEEGLVESDRIRFVTEEGQASLIISPGPSPFTYYFDDDAFRLVCIGYNNFAADAVYVDFIAPHYNVTQY